MPEADVTLRDGRTVHLREMRTTDEAEIIQAFERLTAEARYLRFLRHVKAPNRERLRAALASLPAAGIALVATAPAADGYDIVGSAIAMLTGQATCEFAVTVDLRYAGAGLAKALMQQLIAAARQRGLRMMEGIVLPENDSMLGLARRLGFSVEVDPEDPALRLCRLPLSSPA